MALNKVILQGNLCRDNEINNDVLRNTIAVSRNYVKEGEERQSDFISIVSFGKQAEFINKYFQKGSPIIIEGHIQTGSYEKEGEKKYTTDIIVESVNFVGSKNNKDKEDVNNTTINSDDDLPF